MVKWYCIHVCSFVCSQDFFFLVFRTCFFVKNEIDMFSDGYVQCCHLLCVVKLIERLNTPVFDVGICTKSVLVCVVQ